MNMVSVEITKENKGDLGMGNKWPHGMRLQFEKELFKKIPLLENSNVGDKMIIHAECCIISKSERERSDDVPDKNLEMQIEKIAVMQKTAKKTRRNESKRIS